ncbi:MAG: hypothetical protein K8T25_00250 [Planctomycetia bacterium]|nr:hypothetical protein [Planctomycetia bacterium]
MWRLLRQFILRNVSARNFSPLKRPVRRRVAAAAALFYLVAWIGFPLPQLREIAAGDVESSEPFPCQHHHCGCVSAEQCWRNCCCMTMPQRLAWAKANGVTPPAWVTALAGEQAKASQAVAASKGDSPLVLLRDSNNGSLRERGTVPACTPAKKKPCCSHCCVDQHEENHDQPLREQPPKSSAIGWVSLIEAQRCSGGSVEWLASGAVLPPIRPIEVERDITPGGELPEQIFLACHTSFIPPVPPPRG